jgi:uncharacterized damage-inducible protein DinB
MPTLESILPLNRQAVAAILERARAIPADKWTVPRAPGKWSPAQVIEHVTKSYEGHRQMAQGAELPAAAPWLMQWAARTFFLPRMFKLGDFPGKSQLKSPPFILPSDVPAPASELLPRLEAAASGLEQDLARAGDRKVKHPFFGPLTAGEMLNFVVVHTNHHRPQVVPQA